MAGISPSAPTHSFSTTQSCRLPAPLNRHSRIDREVQWAWTRRSISQSTRRSRSDKVRHVCMWRHHAIQKSVHTFTQSVTKFVTYVAPPRNSKKQNCKTAKQQKRKERKNCKKEKSAAHARKAQRLSKVPSTDIYQVNSFIQITE